MTKITFTNGTTPALNATNLNQMQTNIENAINALIPVQLFNNTSGTLSTITLSETSANFTYLEIFYTRNTADGFSSVKVYSPNGKYANLMLIPAQISNDIGFYGARIYINGTSITFQNGKGMTINGSGDNFYKSGYSITNEIKIFRVIGYR